MIILTSVKSIVGLALTFMIKDYVFNILMCKVNVSWETEQFVFVNQFYINVATRSVVNKLVLHFLDSNCRLTISFHFLNDSEAAVIATDYSEDTDNSEAAEDAYNSEAAEDSEVNEDVDK